VARRSIPTVRCSERLTSRTAAVATRSASEEVTESILTEYLHEKGGEVIRARPERTPMIDQQTPPEQHPAVGTAVVDRVPTTPQTD